MLVEKRLALLPRQKVSDIGLAWFGEQKHSKSDKGRSELGLIEPCQRRILRGVIESIFIDYFRRGRALPLNRRLHRLVTGDQLEIAKFCPYFLCVRGEMMIK